MSSWFSNIYNTLTSKPNSTKVIEIKQDKYSDRTVRSRDEGIILYEPLGKESSYEIILLRSYLENLNTAYSIYRGPESMEADTKFIVFKDKLPILHNICKEASSVSGIQKICDVINEHPTWTVGHIVIHLNLLDVVNKPAIQPFMNTPDPITGIYPIHLAVQNNNIPALKALLRIPVKLYVVDNDGNGLYHFASKSSKEMIMALPPEIISSLNYRNSFGYTPLHLACLADERECVKALLTLGADVNIDATEFSNASHSSNISGDVGKIVKEFDGKLHEEDIKTGGTPLHWSCSKEVIENLIQGKCNVNATNFDGRTALHIMALRERVECAVSLLCYGCSVDAKDNEGNTALHIAAEKANPNVIKALVVFGANLECRNKKNETPRHIVSQKLGSDAGRKALYILHAVGASRCNNDSDSSKCTFGCSPSGRDNGLAPPLPRIMPVRSVVHLFKHKLNKKEVQGGRLLSLDGGGIRGLVLVVVLLHLERTLNIPIVHAFDWIAGTSTGGILALALAAGKSLEECLCLYFKLKEKTFIGTRPYSSEPLQACLEEVFGSLRMGDLKGPKLLITALVSDTKPADLHLFRNYKSPSDVAYPHSTSGFKEPSHDEFPVWKAARASGAAPSYFRMFERYLDGGLIANNPTLDALTEIEEYNMALEFNGQAEKMVELSVVVSVGTGCIPVDNVRDIDVYRPGNIFDTMKVIRGVSSLGVLLVDQATLADGRVVDRARAWCNAIRVPYYRFSPQLSEDIAMDEKDDIKLVNMLWEAKAYTVQYHDEFVELASLLRSGHAQE